MPNKFLSLDLENESTKQKEGIIEEPKEHEFEYFEEDIGYLLGWFCGGILVFALIISLVNLISGNRRKAFQAFVVPFPVIAWVLILLSSIEEETIGMLLIIGGIIFLPILTIWVLRNLPWPPRSYKKKMWL